MLTEEMNLALNRQMNEEYYSSWLYHSMRAWCAKEDYPGIASWLRCQTREEQDHGQRIFDFIIERDGTVELSAVNRPTQSWESLIHLFRDALINEQKVTAAINRLLEEAQSAKDYGTVVFLHWFVTEQVEEEASVLAILKQLERSGDCSASLLYVDSVLGKRKETDSD